MMSKWAWGKTTMIQFDVAGNISQDRHHTRYLVPVCGFSNKYYATIPYTHDLTIAIPSLSLSLSLLLLVNLSSVFFDFVQCWWLIAVCIWIYPHHICSKKNKKKQSFKILMQSNLWGIEKMVRNLNFPK